MGSGPAESRRGPFGHNRQPDCVRVTGRVQVSLHDVSSPRLDQTGTSQLRSARTCSRTVGNRGRRRHPTPSSSSPQVRTKSRSLIPRPLATARADEITYPCRRPRLPIRHVEGCAGTSLAYADPSRVTWKSNISHHLVPVLNGAPEPTIRHRAPGKVRSHVLQCQYWSWGHAR